jgi:hypothetical protein
MLINERFKINFLNILYSNPIVTLLMGSEEGMEFGIPCFREVFNKYQIIVACKVGDVIRGICYLYMNEEIECRIG